MDAKMVPLALVAFAGTFALLLIALSPAVMVLWYLAGVCVRSLTCQLAPWHNPNPDWWILPLALASFAAIVLDMFALFASPKSVYLNPKARGVRIEFRQPSAWLGLVEEPRCSDCYMHVTVTHVAADGRRTSVEVTELSREGRESPEDEPERTVRWATNGSNRAVVITELGETILLPDLLPLPADVPESAINAYLEGQPTDVVLQLLQPEKESGRPPTTLHVAPESSEGGAHL